MEWLKDLWRGRLPLEIAFWHYAFFYGLVVNIIATGMALVLIVLDLPIAIALIVHLLPTPYAVVAMTGVWRSADRYRGPRNMALLARFAVLAWFAFWFAF